MDKQDWIIAVAILVLPLISGAVASIQYIKGVKSSKDNEKLTNSLLKKSDELAKANKKNLELSGLLNNKANDIIKNNLKVIEAQNVTLKHVVGSGYPSIHYMKKGNEQWFLAIKKSEVYPIYDINIEIRRVDKILPTRFIKDGLPHYDLDTFLANTIDLRSFNLNSTTDYKRTDQIIKFDTGVNHIQYIYTTRHGDFTENHIVVYNNGRISTLRRIYRQAESGNVLLQEFNDNGTANEEYWETHFIERNSVIINSQDR